MPIRFSISGKGDGETLEHNLIALSYRLFDLKPMADRAQVVMERQNADGASMGIDKDGVSYVAIKEETWRRRPGSGPPLSPRDAGSRVVTEFRVRQEASFDAINVIGSWPGIPWLGAHVRGGGRLPVRNPVGMRPHAMQQLAVEFHDWVQEILKGGPGSGPSVSPGTGGGGGPYPTTPPAGGSPTAPRSPAPPARPAATAARPAAGANPAPASQPAAEAVKAKAKAKSPTKEESAVTSGAAEAEAMYAGTRVDYGAGWKESEVRTIIRQTFGRDMTPRELARLVGAPEDTSRIRIDPTYPSSTGVEINVTSPSLRVMRRTITARRGFGEYAERATSIHNDEIEVWDSGKGLGTKIFSNQVEQAAKAGFQRIDTYAARDDEYGYVGYSTWPKLGYDGGIPHRVQELLPKELKGAVKVSELMATPQGRQFWNEHGTSTEMSFDLSPGSYSRRTLDAYLKAKGLK